MEAVCNWSIVEVFAKPSYTDKFGNLRENVINRVALECTAEYNGEKSKKRAFAKLSLIDLTNFSDSESLTKEQVLAWALASMSPYQKDMIEKSLLEEVGATQPKVNKINL